MFAARFFIVCLVLGLGVALLAGQDVAAQDTLLFSYQGRLTDNAGNPLDGVYDLTFSIYAVSGGGAPLWSELHPGVVVAAGLFSVTLGSQTALPDSVFTGDTRYLGITVNDNPEITPRTMLTSVASAAYARRVAGDVTTGAGTMLIKTPAGDSAFSFDAGTAKASLPSFTMHLMEPLDKQPLIEMNTSSDIGGRISIYDMEPLDKNELVSISGSPFDGANIRMFNPQPEPPARLLEMNVSQNPQTLEYGSRLSMYLMEPLDKKALEISTFPSNGASFKMFNPQPEPPAVLFEINASPTTGLSLNIYDEIGQVMGVEPSPFGQGYGFFLMNPNDAEHQVEITANHVTNVASFKLIEPGDDGVTPAIEMTSGPLGSYFNINGYDAGLGISHDAFSVDVDNIDLVTSVKMIEPGNDITPGFEFTADGLTNLASLRILDPNNSAQSLTEISGGLSGGSIYMFNPQPEPPALLFDLSVNVGKSSDDIEMSLTSGDSTFQTKITPGRVKVGHPTIDSYARGEFNAGSDSITFFMQGQSIGAPAPPIGMLSSSSEAKLAIGSMTAGEPLVVGKDLGSWNGDRIVVGDDTPGEYTGLVAGESSDHRGWLLWNIDDDFLSMGLEVGLAQYNNLLTLRNGRVGINTNSPSADLHVAGDICYTGSIGACSDLRYKRDVHTLDHSLEKVARLRGVSFAWKTEAFPEQRFSDDEQVGLIAQEVNEVVPEVVSRTADGYYNVDYTKLTPLLVEAIKELKAENEELRSRIERLERQ